MTEKVKRLELKPETKRALFLRSGNLCAFPNCSRLMMDIHGNWVGQICHIEAAEEGGERFNYFMTNEDRRSESNLLLLCYEHHVLTNNVVEFPVSRMQELKRQHEQRFSDPEYRMLETIRDFTLATQPRHVQNMNKLFSASGWHPDTNEHTELLSEINSYIEKFSRIPINVRHFLGQFAFRMDYLARVHGLWRDAGKEFVHVADLEGAFRLKPEEVNSIFSQLRSYGLGEIEEVSGSDLRPPYGAFLFRLDNDWDFWRDVAKFCYKENMDITVIVDQLNFSVLDT